MSFLVIILTLVAIFSRSLLFEVDKLAIYKDDLNCLGERRWLNDKVIKLHLNALKNKRDKKDEVYIFDSLFFDKLMSIKK
jgi:Ulp1 family protease